MSHKYKSKSGVKDFVVPGVGQAINGILESNEVLESPALVEVTEEATSFPHTEAATPVAQPGAVIGVAPQATQPTSATVSQSTPSSESEGVK